MCESTVIMAADDAHAISLISIEVTSRDSLGSFKALPLLPVLLLLLPYPKGQNGNILVFYTCTVSSSAVRA